MGFISSPGFPYISRGNCTYSIEKSGQDSATIIFPVFYLHDRYENRCTDEEDWVEVSYTLNFRPNCDSNQLFFLNLTLYRFL